MPQTRWNTEALWQQLEPLLPGLSIEVVARTDSTNTQLLERARLHSPRSAEGHAAYGRRAGDTQPCLLVAEQQTGGRGRHGRQWKSSPDVSLTFSLSLLLQRTDWSGLSLAVGLAVAEALDPSGKRLQLKWPNDLMLLDADGGARKLGGVLIESVAVATRRLAAVGVGINVGPSEFAELSSGYAHTQELDPADTPPRVLARVAPALVRMLLDFDREGFAPLQARYLARDVLRGRRIQLLPAGAGGVADGVAADGALRMRADEGGMQLVSSGEISVRLAAP